MKKSQRQRIINELNQSGRISRNYVLNLPIWERITKLATLISSLKSKENWDIETVYEKDANGFDDVVYYVRKSPLTKTIYKVAGIEKEITLWN